MQQDQITSVSPNSTNAVLNEVPSIYALKLHEITEVHQPPYYRIMRVASGWLYNFYDCDKAEYQGGWTFVPFDNAFQ